jgi:hypothetical protein
MKRIHIAGLVDIVLVEDAAEIESLGQDPKLDRAYSDRSLLVNGFLLRHVRKVLQFRGKPFPTVTSRSDQERAAAQEVLWNRLNALVPAFSTGSDDLENLAVFVRGEGSAETCGPLVQQVVGRLFAPNFQATPASWSAALVLEKAPRTMNPILLAWWAVTGRVSRSKQLLSDMVGGNLAAVHAVGIALHNIVKGVNLMRQLYKDASERATLSPEAVGSRCLFAPATVIRQPTAPDSSASGELQTGTVVLLKLQTANAVSPNRDVAFLRRTWSRCPAEQWVPALLEGIWRRACRLPSSANPNGKAGGCPI